MGKRNYYELLGIGPNATEIEIKKAYRTLAILHHPDKNQGNPQSESRFKEIVEAYNVLLNPRDRALYEQFGNSLTPTNISQQDNFNLMDTVFSVAGDFLNLFWGNRNGGKSRTSKDPHLEHKIDIPFQDAARGKDIPISYNRLQACGCCKGTGAYPGTRPVVCPRCQGHGEERKIGSFMTRITCIGCNGTGKIIPEPCTQCNGAGRVSRKRKIKISIPPETKDGDILKIPHEGEAGENSGPYGYLYVVVQVT